MDRLTRDPAPSVDGDSPPRSQLEVDRSLIRWMLSLTPTARLQVLQKNVRLIARLRRARERP
ncbi:MAG: hypothetical protein PVF51_05365 [Nitrospirota bacterium]|jgi:hypothetical protein